MSNKEKVEAVAQVTKKLVDMVSPSLSDLMSTLYVFGKYKVTLALGAGSAGGFSDEEKSIINDSLHEVVNKINNHLVVNDLFTVRIAHAFWFLSEIAFNDKTDYILKALLDLMDRAPQGIEYWQAQSISMSIMCLKRSDLGGSSESIRFIEKFTEILSSFSGRIETRHIGNMLSGVKNFATHKAGIDFCSTLSKFIPEATGVMSGQEISNSLLIMKRDNVTSTKSKKFLEVLYTKIHTSDAVFDGQQMANILFSLKNMKLQPDGVVENLFDDVITRLKRGVTTAPNTYSISMCLEGLSSIALREEFGEILTDTIKHYASTFTAKGVITIIGSLQRTHVGDSIIINTMKALTYNLNANNKLLDVVDESSNFFDKTPYSTLLSTKALLNHSLTLLYSNITTKVWRESTAKECKQKPLGYFVHVNQKSDNTQILQLIDSLYKEIGTDIYCDIDSSTLSDTARTYVDKLFLLGRSEHILNAVKSAHNKYTFIVEIEKTEFTTSWCTLIEEQYFQAWKLDQTAGRHDTDYARKIMNFIDLNARFDYSATDTNNITLNALVNARNIILTLPSEIILNDLESIITDLYAKQVQATGGEMFCKMFMTEQIFGPNSMYSRYNLVNQVRDDSSEYSSTFSELAHLLYEASSSNIFSHQDRGPVLIYNNREVPVDLDGEERGEDYKDWQASKLSDTVYRENIPENNDNKALNFNDTISWPEIQSNTMASHEGDESIQLIASFDPWYAT